MRARTSARLLASSLRQSTPELAARYKSSSATASSSSSTWRPALKRGTLAAYDEALDYLSAHRDKCVAEHDRLHALPNPTNEQRMQADALEVDGYVNDPATRSEFRRTQGQGSMGRPVMRHLAERKWKQEGGLDLIMGRVYQNKVVPDVLPDIAPLNPFTLSTSDGTVEPGQTVDVTTLEQPPLLQYQGFLHPSHPTADEPNPSALYTLLAVDPDVPDAAKQAFGERLHYLKTDIPLSVISGETALIQEAAGNETISWEPLAPAPRTLKHRLVFILFRQPASTLEPLSASAHIDRGDFSVRSFMKTFGFQLDSVVGVNLVKGEYDPEHKKYTDRIWRDFRGVAKAPVFNEIPPYEKFARPLSSVQKRAAALRESALKRSMAEYEASLAPQNVDQEMQRTAKEVSAESQKDVEQDTKDAGAPGESTREDK